MKKWDIIKNEFSRDGSLRDIYILDTNQNTWEAFLELIKESNHSYSFNKDGEEYKKNLNYEEICKLQEKYTILLSIEINKEIIANCHFFCEEEIELDILPQTIKNERDYLILYSFLQWLSKSLSKDITITHENSQDMIIDKIKQEAV